MSTWFRDLAIAFGLRLARIAGWTPPICARPHLPDGTQVELARAAIREVARCHPLEPGPVKARDALRMLQNQIPDARTRDLNLLIELALQGEP